MSSRGTFLKLSPLSLLTHISSCYDTAHLQVSSNSVSWSIYLRQGKITYASHSIEPFDRLDRHLRRFSTQLPTLVSEIRAQLRRDFDIPQPTQNADYQALCWLVAEQYLNPAQVSILIEGLVKEAIESFLLITQGTYQFGYQQDTLPEFCRLDLEPILKYCQRQLQGWQALAPQIWSPYQRPYWLNQTRQLLPQHQLSSILKGFSFYHLAVLQNQDELQLAQSLHPYVVDGTILLYDPHPPFEQLPKIEQLSIPVLEKSTVSVLGLKKLITEPIVHHVSVQKKTYTIICVDNNPTILEKFSLYLDDNISVIAINNSTEALMQIITLNPDLIFIDVTMPVISGYDLCRLLRHHPFFKTKPIIILKENLKIIDRIEAKFIGASGCLPKPFTQAELLKIVFRYLI